MLKEPQESSLLLVLAQVARVRHIRHVGRFILHETLIGLRIRRPGIAGCRQLQDRLATSADPRLDSPFPLAQFDIEPLPPVREVPDIDGVLARREGGAAEMERVERGLGKRSVSLDQRGHVDGHYQLLVRSGGAIGEVEYGSRENRGPVPQLYWRQMRWE